MNHGDEIQDFMDRQMEALDKVDINTTSILRVASKGFTQLLGEIAKQLVEIASELKQLRGIRIAQ